MTLDEKIASDDIFVALHDKKTNNSQSKGVVC